MNASKKANETSRSKPARILAGVGNLRAMMWKSEERWKVAILREDPVTGEFDHLMTPDDIESLAELTTLIATALHEHADLDAELIGDLGCLSHHLAQTLGMKKESCVFVPKSVM